MPQNTDVGLAAVGNTENLQAVSFPQAGLQCEDHDPTLAATLAFEIKSWLGRVFKGRLPRSLPDQTRLLHLGAGSHLVDGWINADFFSFHGLRFWKKPPRRPEWMLDLRFPLKCPDNYWDGVFSEHTLEHLSPAQVLRLLKEVHRSLKPGMWVRIVVPDLDKYIAYFNGEACPPMFKQWPTGIEALRSLTQNWGHRSLWNAALMGRFLAEAGFVDVAQVEFGAGRSQSLAIEREARKDESLYIEGRKPSR